MSFVLSGVPEFLGYIYLYRHNLAFRGHGIPKERGGVGEDMESPAVLKKEHVLWKFQGLQSKRKRNFLGCSRKTCKEFPYSS